MRSLVLLLPLLAATAEVPVYTISTFAGTTWTGDGRSATSAVLVQPSGIVVDSAGKVYVADAGDHRVRCVGTDGAIRTVAGTGVPGLTGSGDAATASALNSPYGLAIDSLGNLFIADLGNGLVRRVGTDGRMITVAGGGLLSPSTIAAPATKIKLKQPRDLALDALGNLFISDFGAHQVYRVTPDGNLTVIVGSGNQGRIYGTTVPEMAPLNAPAGLVVDASGVLYIADSGNHRVRKLSGGWLSTVVDKNGTERDFIAPTGLALDSGQHVYVADGGDRLAVLWANGEFLSLSIGGKAVGLGPNGEVFTIVGRQVLRLTGASTTVVAGSLTGPGAGDGTNKNEWRFQSPSSLVRDSVGNIFVADTGNGRVRKISASGQLSTVTTRLSQPSSVALDSQSRLYAGDRYTGGIYRIDPDGQLRLIAGGAYQPILPTAMVFDRLDNLYIADGFSEVIRRVGSDGSMTVVAGGGTLIEDDIALLLKLNAPSGLAFDADGGLWFPEASTGQLRRLWNGRITTLKGLTLKEPRGIRMDSTGNLLIADASQHRVLRVSPDGSWIPLAGSGDKGFAGDGDMALAGMLNGPVDVLPLEDGGLLVLDSGNNRIRMLQRKTSIDPGTPQPVDPNARLEVVHAATLKAGAFAPGQLIYVTGESLGRAQVTIGGVQASVLAATGQRLTVQVPSTATTGSIELKASEGTESRGKADINLASLSPGILTVSDGRGQALAVNQDGQPNGIEQPAGRTSVISLFLTGDGGGAPTVSAEIGGYNADVLWSGAAPGLPGVFQANVRMPGGFAPSGVVHVVLTVNGTKTQQGVTVVSR